MCGILHQCLIRKLSRAKELFGNSCLGITNRPLFILYNLTVYLKGSFSLTHMLVRDEFFVAVIQGQHHGVGRYCLRPILGGRIISDWAQHCLHTQHFQRETMRKMVIERHNIAARHIVEAISGGDNGENIIFTDIGSDAKFMEQSLARSEQTANKTPPSWFLPHLLATDLHRSSRPDAILVLPTNLPTDCANIPPVQSLPPSNWDVHLIEVKYCTDTRTDTQIRNATEQHQRLVIILKAQGCKHISI